MEHIINFQYGLNKFSKIISVQHKTFGICITTTSWNFIATTLNDKLGSDFPTGESSLAATIIEREVKEAGFTILKFNVQL